MPPHSQTRVLVIDDDEMSREVLVAFLDASGFSATAAESGPAALALLESLPMPDLVLTDMQMPGSTPEQLAQGLRRACGPGTPLLAISGSPPPAATLAHFDGFLLKPFSAATLTALLRQISLPGVVDTVTASGEPAAPTPASHRAPPSGDAAPPQNAPILDETIYGQLAASMPAPQLKEMYSMCLNDTRARIASMRSLAGAQPEQFMRQAHAVKGSCGMLGASELHRLASRLEAAGPDAADSAVNSLDELTSACDRLERMLRARA